MDFELSEDTLMLRDMLQRFVKDEALPMEMKYFATGALESKDRARLRTVIEQLGLWNVAVPEKFGGGGLDMITTCVLEEELGKTFLPVELGDVPPLLYACRGDQVNRYLKPALAGKRHPQLALREPDAVHPENWATTATPNGDSYILNGVKTLGNFPAPDDFLVIFANAPAGTTAFVLEPNQPGLTISKNGKITVHMDGCTTTSTALLGESGKAFSLGVDDAPRATIRIGARYTGLARRLVDMAANYANDWQSLGAPLKARPANQRMLAELHVQVESTRWFVYHAAWMADQGGPLRATATEVRLATGDLLQRATDMVTMLYGGPGPTLEIDVRRWVHSAIPMDALELGLDYARATIAANLLAQAEAKAT